MYNNNMYLLYKIKYILKVRKSEYVTQKKVSVVKIQKICKVRKSEYITQKKVSVNFYQK